MNATEPTTAGEYLNPQQVSDSFGRLVDGSPRVPLKLVYDWIRFGCRTAGGVVMLPAERVGARLYVTPAALATFRARITSETADPAAAPAPTETPAQERRRAKRAQAEAAALLN